MVLQPRTLILQISCYQRCNLATMERTAYQDVFT